LDFYLLNYILIGPAAWALLWLGLLMGRARMNRLRRPPIPLREHNLLPLPLSGQCRRRLAVSPFLLPGRQSLRPCWPMPVGSGESS